MSKKENLEEVVETEIKKILPAGNLPQSVLDINKKYKTTKITTLDKAKSFILKRMFSGSVLADELSGGGWGYKRIHMLYGYRSSGKNALWNQTVAYNQRICRHCLGILPQDYNNEHDRHARFLRYVLGIPECRCEKSEGRKFFILDYEKSLSIEDEEIIIVKNIMDKKTEEKISEEYYDSIMLKLNELSIKENLIEQEKEEIRNIEKWIKTLNIEEQEIIHESSKDYLIKCGVKINELLVADPEDIEEGIEMIRPMVKDNSVDGIMWDSIQSANSVYVKERSSENATMGSEPKSFGLLMKHVFSSFAAKDLEDEKEAFKPVFFMTSQMRSSLGGFIAKADSFSGGHSIAHSNSLILELKKEKYVKADGSEATFKDSFFGQNIRIRAEKNKLAAPGDMYEITYYFKDSDFCKTGEIDHIKEIVMLGIEKNKIVREGNTYYPTGDRNEKFVGFEKLTTFFRENPEFVGKVYKNIKR
jgi:RecA/RadA recombinase